MSTHLLKLKDLAPTDRISTDDWLAVQYDALHDLGFELDNIYNMEFDHETTVDGKEKHISVSVHKTQDGKWHLELQGKRDGKIVKREYKKFDTLMNVIHNIFKKF